MIKFSKKQTGDIGEDYACKYLEKNRYKIIERNYRKKCGEIDIVAENKDYLIFVEVKTRHQNPMSQPYEAVNLYKRRRIIKTAYSYLAEHETEKYCRFDICEVFVNSDNLKLLNLNYIEDAFQEDDCYESY